MNNNSIVDCLRVDDWTAESVIIASNENAEFETFSQRATKLINKTIATRWPAIWVLGQHPYKRVFHDLSTTQEWQYCQLCLGHVIQN